MKRRRFVQSLAAAPAASKLLAQQVPVPPPGTPANTAPGVPQNATRGNQPPGAASQELPRLEPSVPDLAADTIPHFFTAAQFEALRRLCELMMPATDGHPGAVEARAPEFLDFLIGDSPAERQQLYREGLDSLNEQSSRRFNKQFSAISAEQASELLAPLSQPWQYNPPSDTLGRFLVAAKSDIRTATVNSREYVTAPAAVGSRRFGGTGLYWRSLD